MKKISILIALVLCLLGTVYAHAQGTFPGKLSKGQIVGNPGTVPALPAPFSGAASNCFGLNSGGQLANLQCLAGTPSGNTTVFVTGSGAFVTGDCPIFDSHSNLIDSGSPRCSGDITAFDTPSIGQIGIWHSATSIGGVTALPTTLVKNILGGNFSIMSSTQGDVISSQQGSANTITLPQATGAFGASWSALIENDSNANVMNNLVPTTSTLNGRANYILAPGDWCQPISDGTNYFGPCSPGSLTGYWAADSSGNLLPSVTGTYSIGSSSFKIQNLTANGSLTGNNITSGFYIQAAATGQMFWVGRAQMSSPADGIVQITNQAQNAPGSFELASTPLTLAAGELGLAKITASGSAPGASGLKFGAVCGTNSGSAKIVAYAGTSTAPVTIVDNIGSGVTGC